jgi:Fe-S-cluster-containing dehydrogenase component
MIHLEQIQREDTVQTTPIICMHCEEPACAAVCPADAIKRTPDGVVQSSLKPRCIGCTNCVYACPFGVPKYDVQIDQMIKCDMCYDRTSIGKKPMCATVCPSQALFYGTSEEIAEYRGGTPINEFVFGGRTIKTKVSLMMPKGTQRMVVENQTPIRKTDLLTQVRLSGTMSHLQENR